MTVLRFTVPGRVPSLNDLDADVHSLLLPENA